MPLRPTIALDGKSLPKVLGTSLVLTEIPAFPTLVLQRFLSQCEAPVAACDPYTFIHSVSYSRTGPPSVPEVTSHGPSPASGCLKKRNADRMDWERGSGC